MADPFRFVPRKKRAGVYFNIGDGCNMSMQELDETKPDWKLRRAIVAARKEFDRVMRADETAQP